MKSYSKVRKYANTLFSGFANSNFHSLFTKLKFSSRSPGSRILLSSFISFGAFILSRLTVGESGSGTILLIFIAGLVAASTLGGVRTGMLNLFVSAVLILLIFSRSGVVTLNEALVFILIGIVIIMLLYELVRSENKATVSLSRLKESEEKFRMLVEDVKDYSIYMLDRKGRIVGWNKGAERIEGYKSEEVLGKSFGIFHPKEDRKKGMPEKKLKLAAERGRYEDEGWRLKKNGELFWANAILTPIYDDNHELTGFSKITRDLTEKRQIEERLRESERRFRTMSDTAPVMIWEMDENMNFSYFNKVWNEFTGETTIEQNSLEKLRDIISDEDYEHFIDLIKEAYINKNEIASEIRIKNKSGEYHWVIIKAVPRFSEHDEFLGYIGTALDISDRKELERQKDEFISIASHELKTPLTSLRTFSHLLKKRIDKAQEEYDRFMGKMDTQVGKLDSFINDLLDVSRIQGGKLSIDKKLININQVVQDTVEDLQGTIENHKLNLVINNRSNIYADGKRIEQVLVNFLTNAVKYSPDSSQIEILISEDMENVRVSVKDYGVGLSEEQRDKVFERFYRAQGKDEKKYPGLGIGLYICSQIIQQHQGKVGVMSEEGNGSTFWFTLPKTN